MSIPVELTVYLYYGCVMEDLTVQLEVMSTTAQSL